MRLVSGDNFVNFVLHFHYSERRDLNSPQKMTLPTLILEKFAFSFGKWAFKLLLPGTVGFSISYQQ